MLEAGAELCTIPILLGHAKLAHTTVHTGLHAAQTKTRSRDPLLLAAGGG
jgi:site-specific recombinase XerD